MTKDSVTGSSTESVHSRDSSSPTGSPVPGQGHGHIQGHRREDSDTDSLLSVDSALSQRVGSIRKYGMSTLKYLYWYKKIDLQKIHFIYQFVLQALSMRRGSAGVTESPKSTNKVCDGYLHSSIGEENSIIESCQKSKSSITLTYAF